MIPLFKSHVFIGVTLLCNLHVNSSIMPCYKIECNSEVYVIVISFGDHDIILYVVWHDDVYVLYLYSRRKNDNNPSGTHELKLFWHPKLTIFVHRFKHICGIWLIRQITDYVLYQSMFWTYTYILCQCLYIYIYRKVCPPAYCLTSYMSYDTLYYRYLIYKAPPHPPTPKVSIIVRI